MRLLLSLLVFLAFAVQAQKQIVITIDDLPTVSKAYATPEGRLNLTKKLLSHCTAFQVPAIGFVIGNSLRTNSKPDSNQIGLLKLWLNAGLELGNHTLAHKDYNNISFEGSKADIIGGESIVKNLVQQRERPFRYFRHPYLRKGDTQAKKDSLEQFLKQRGYQEAPVTIDNSDWLFSRAYDNALLLSDTALAAQVGKQYVTYMLNCAAYYEAQSDSLFNRQISQILLIHANTINADFLGKLLAGLKQHGYTFVSLDKALTDTAYRSVDHYYGKGGISWLHRWALTLGKKGAFFKGEPEVPAMVDELANRTVNLPGR
ncbi:polysaccharide deacetylase family protein [Spirosoma sp. KCTC 42546]|uniref:polysaccharide deacetylase family protein n=1 Tax=Spirosoma sp. KCTC 42546 TaxID=2520506 RepID=UPI00115A58ED|nr:polysaccharide deacetylase family protein [Spirosoma sp. KCTC 42546]QDK83446.1 polysaccharide deacetylase family protein [Spirosoma sp. KCTC 42546]